jgi:hypothetical protein
MPAAVVGGNIVYPNLESISRLFRAQINDTFTNADGTQGLIMPNTNPDLLTFLDSAIRDTYSDLRNVGDPELILDNYCLIGLPPLAQPDPTVQVSLGYQGFFDGFQWHPQWTLPVSSVKVERMWERWSGNQISFSPMTPAPFGLPPLYQTQCMGQWEVRQNAIWMPGCLVSTDLRLRCRITYPDFQEFNPANINFDTAYVPILGCTNAVAAKMLVLYAGRFAPELKPQTEADDEKYIFKLKLEVVRNMQNTEYQRQQYGDAATAGYGWLAQL